MKYSEQIKNKTLIKFEDIKEVVLSSSFNIKPKINHKKKGEDKTLLEFITLKNEK